MVRATETSPRRVVLCGPNGKSCELHEVASHGIDDFLRSDEHSGDVQGPPIGGCSARRDSYFLGLFQQVSKLQLARWWCHTPRSDGRSCCGCGRERALLWLQPAEARGKGVFEEIMFPSPMLSSAESGNSVEC